jgi:hypothetical protein
MAAKVNIIIDQGATFFTTFTIESDTGTPIDFTNYTANSQMRKSYTSSTAYTFDVALSNTGSVNLSMNASTTNSITAGRYLYDVEVQDSDGVRSRIVEGIVTVTPQITR